MNSAFIYSVIIGFVGAALFLFVDKYERDGTAANLLKFLVLVVGGNPTQIEAVRPCVILAPRHPAAARSIPPIRFC